MCMSVWIRKYCKRFLGQKIFLVLLFVMPVGTLLFAAMANRDDTSVRVGIVCADDRSLGGRIGQELLEHRGIVRFCRMDSDAQMQEAISRGEIECGYSFPDDMGEKYQQEQYTGLVKQYFRRGSMLHAIAREVVLTGIFRQYAKDIATSYIWDSGMFYTQSIAPQEISESYQKNIKDQTTFTFTFNDSTKVQSKLGDYLVAPVRGCVSLLILLAGFCGISLYRTDQQKEIPVAFGGRIRSGLSVLSIAVPVCLITVVGIASEAVCGVGFLSPKEIVYLLIYDIIVVLFCNLLSYVGVRAGLLWVLALGYVCACAVFTPVFIDMSALVPGVQVLSHICLTNYFLEAVFGGGWELVHLLLLLVSVLGANWILYKITQGSARCFVKKEESSGK